MSRAEKSYSTIIEIDRHGNPHYVLKIDSNKPDSEDEYANLLFKPLELYVSKNVLEQDKEPRENKEHKERDEHKEEEEAKKKRKYNLKNQNVSNDSSSTNEPTISLEDRAQFLNENPVIPNYIISNYKLINYELFIYLFVYLFIRINRLLSIISK